MYQGNLDSNKFLMVRVPPRCCSGHRHEYKPGRGQAYKALIDESKTMSKKLALVSKIVDDGQRKQHSTELDKLHQCI